MSGRFFDARLACPMKDHPLLLVPRAEPVQEQLIRARRLAA